MVDPVAPFIYPTDRYYYSWDSDPAPQPPSNRDIKSMVVERLQENEYTRDDDISVDVKEDVVILTGTVSSTRAKRAAGDDSWDTPGVADVSNQLAVSSRAA